MSWLDSSEKTGSEAGLELFLFGEVVEFSAGVSHAGGVFVFAEDADSSADGDGGVFVVTGDDDDSDAGGGTWEGVSYDLRESR